MNITSTALTKINSLTDDDLAFRIHITGALHQGYHLDLILNVEPDVLDVIIYEEPKVVADFNSMNYLSGTTVDFDPVFNEFVIRTKAPQ